MNTTKEFFLSAIGVSVPNDILEYDVFIQKHGDTTPSFGIIHKKDGSVVLRVNPWEYDGIVFKT